jgi:hypothetical protein
MADDKVSELASALHCLGPRLTAGPIDLPIMFSQNRLRTTFLITPLEAKYLANGAPKCESVRSVVEFTCFFYFQVDGQNE